MEPMAEAEARAEIKVTVTFPLAEGPYHGEFAPETTVGAVRAAAMSELGVGGDAQYSYYLTNKNDRQADEITIGSLAGRARAVKFTLVKELTQG
jgi:hypothetical protein